MMTPPLHQPHLLKHQQVNLAIVRYLDRVRDVIRPVFDIAICADEHKARRLELHSALTNRRLRVSELLSACV